MTAFDVLFYLFAAITVLSAFVTVFSRNIVYSAFSLLFTFFGVAGIYVLLSADFLAVTQLLVYVGGILILLIFGVMLTNRITGAEIRVGSGVRWPVGILSIGLLIALGSTIFTSHWITFRDAPWSKSPWNTDAVAKILSLNQGAASEIASGSGSQGTAQEIGKLFLSDYLLPFEVVSVVLLIALIGAAMIARKDNDISLDDDTLLSMEATEA